jgi:hypothetical protein
MKRNEWPTALARREEVSPASLEEIARGLFRLGRVRLARLTGCGSRGSDGRS